MRKFINNIFPLITLNSITKIEKIINRSIIPYYFDSVYTNMLCYVIFFEDVSFRQMLHWMFHRNLQESMKHSLRLLL